MKLGMQTSGSMGDVKPFLVLANGLIRAGHEVTLLIIPSDNKDYSSYASDKLSVRHIWNTSENIDKAFKGLFKNGMMEQMKRPMQFAFYSLLPELISASQELCDENEMVFGTRTQLTLLCIAQIKKTPLILIDYMHAAVPNPNYAAAGLPYMGRRLNLLSWKLVDKLINRLFAKDIKRIREKLLPASSQVKGNPWKYPALKLVVVSRIFFKELPSAKDAIICGYLDFEEDQSDFQSDNALALFLEQGEPPVYFTIGSMILLEDDFDYLVSIFINAIMKINGRGIIQIPEKYFNNPTYANTSEVFFTTALPHSYIFPRCSAVVHHGGAGTLHAATLAGCPSIVIPYAFDQYFWGKELQRTGLTTNLIPRSVLTADRLSECIASILKDKKFKIRAIELSEIMKKENAVRTIVKLTEELGEKITSAKSLLV